MITKCLLSREVGLNGFAQAVALVSALVSIAVSPIELYLFDKPWAA